ncbi:peptide chain release factor N(5)-glutamine methyltransferase [Dietzia sp.]|uniref:peptide chain release factor N(5)-glutamine methyltransferase n=1 Tax=Dietzia sp. TaxID=1871616 RepID=UPI002FD910CA
MTTDVPDLLRELASRLASAGRESGAAEAATIASHAAGISRGELAAAATLPDEVAERARAFAARRADTGEPLQYVLGQAVSGALDLAVGPGVFIPRPETELLVDWVLRNLPAPAPAAGESAEKAQVPVVIDLCAGSGTIALELAHARPGIAVHAVELDPDAATWLRRNAAARAAAGDTPIRIAEADATDLDRLLEVFPELDGSASAVVSNPPYIPAAAEAELPAEITAHEPASALYGGPSGNDVIAGIVPVAARLLAPGGICACEHDDATGDSVEALFEAHGGFVDVQRHRDLAGRPRFVTARRG